MKKRIAFVTALLTLTAVSSVLAAPAAEAKVAPQKKPTKYHLTVSAIPGADEKSFIDSASRCLTAAMKAMNALALKQMNTDIEKHGKDHQTAVDRYKEKMETIWSAMEQPYCGFGSQGLAAVKHSFKKSVDRTRAEFLKATK